ncbi:DCC1-like thiol-disulfide oxidoreductase family protein [Loktanella sp. S4079]|uniref:DCC1-like thiol-disulfide oxidoreductase family protein n=1 Tax=Loktanella sp. S4079 TaxID=579483 RepID=UPI0006967759|nr:DCC1-like thiol-disulfide oxidoreductase family protein [Loktanella sp. S4079]
MPATIYYDGECPFCSQYVALVRLREAVGAVELVDLREVPDMRQELTSEGFDLDQGMVVDLDGRRVGGNEAVNLLAKLSSNSGFFNRVHRLVFGQHLVTKIIYPILRMGRWLTLFLLGRRVINDDNSNAEQRQVLFAALFALFSIFHVFSNMFEYGEGFTNIDIWGIFVAALLLLMRPASPQRLFWLVVISSVSTVIQAPVQSNHTMLRTMVLVGYWLSFIYAAVRARPISEIFGNFVLSGRGALLVMYFYGIFHKINTGFLDPEVSCAVALWNEMLPPINQLQGQFVHYGAIYGTFVIEGILVIALLYKRTRHLGMIGGMAFHMLLTFSNFSAYISFTTLTISLHVLYLSGAQLDRINESSQMVWIARSVRRPTFIFTFVTLISVGAFYMLLRQYNVASLCLLPLVCVVCALILIHGRFRSEDRSDAFSYPAILIGCFVTLLYFVNGAMPYLGVKTAQSVAMFSNLRIEGGQSNHLIFSGADRPVPYVAQIATIDEAANDPSLNSMKERQIGFVYYDLLSYLDKNRDTVISFSVNGQKYEDVGYLELREEIETTLHSRFVRKWLHFRTVDVGAVQRCY